MKKLISLLLVIVMLVSLCSCSKIKSLFSSGEEQSFSYPIAAMPESLDPQIASGEAELIVIENCMEGLVRLNEKGEVKPAVAESWDISADGLQYTFHLNPAAVWSVDTEDEEFTVKNFNKHITAEDFVFAVSRAVKKETKAPDFSAVSLIKNAGKINASGSNDTSSLGIKAIDAQTLRITLESANSEFLKSLTNAVFMPCSKAFFEDCAGRYGRQGKYFLSNGGFEMRAWNETNIVMRKNETYTLSNPAKADTVTLYRDENAYESFKNNNYDALAIDDEHIEDALADTSLKVQTYDDTVWAFGVNCKSELGSYQSLRKALMQGVDKNALQAPAWASEAKGLVPNICTAGGENYREAVGEADYISFHSDNARENYVAFTDKYENNTDENEIPPFRLLCMPAFEKNAKLMAQSWQMIFGTGFDVRISVLSLDELNESVQKGAFDGAILPVSADTSDALVFLKKFSADNAFGYASRAFNEKLDSSQNALNKSKTGENMLLKDAAVYPLFCSNSYYVQREKISGIFFYPFGGKVNFLNAQRAK